MKPPAFQKAILNWFDQYGRKELPWQQNIDAYSVWVSEIMLQQTQVSTVIPYYLRFMDSFPTVQDLAAATTDDVLHHWTGLGYYARARNLHKTAQQVSNGLDGEFPSSVDALCELPGIGRSTAGAISAIVFKQQTPILDGTVKRVLARFCAIDGWPGTMDVVTKISSVAETYTPEARMADYTQAMMDLGATLCTRSSPDCPSCPISSQCIAYKNGNPQDYPGKKPKKVIPVRDTCFLMVTNQQGHWLLEQNPPVWLWGGLWVFPQCDSTEVIEDTLLRLGAKHQGCTILDRKRHTFSHFHLDYHAVHIILADDSHFENQVRESANQVWYNPQKPISLGLPAPIKALLDSVASK